MVVKVLTLLLEGGGTFFPWGKNESDKYETHNNFFIEIVIIENLV